MNDWYALVNGLETEVPSIDEVTLHRIAKKARPKKRIWKLALVLAAVLALTACGYVAVTQFSDWFPLLAENPQQPEQSEDLLASIGTVIGQSQTVDDVTITLQGAICDGRNLFLAVEITGLEGLDDYVFTADPGQSWLYPAKSEISKDWQAYYQEMVRSFSWLTEIRCTADSETGTALLLLEARIGTIEKIWTLHLEGLQIGEVLVPGTVEFEFTPENKQVTRYYTGEKDVPLPEGKIMTVTDVVLTPLEVRIKFRGEGTEDSGLRAYIDKLVLTDGETIMFKSRSATQTRGEDTTAWSGEFCMGPADRIYDPSTVTGILLDNGVLLELKDFQLIESD